MRSRFDLLKLLLVLSYWPLLFSHGFPQDGHVDQTEIPVERQDELVTESGNLDPIHEEEEMLMDMMDRYSEVPIVRGNVSCQCGMPSPRLIAGEEGAMINSYPWTALLYAVESENFKIPYCGGTLINNRYVLTASHCVDGMQPSKVEVVLREQNISSDTNQFMHLMGRHSLSALRIEADRFIQHPAYSRLTLDNDIALVRLKVRLPLEDFPVAPICIPEKEASFSQGLYATVAGYGATSDSRNPSRILQMAEVRVLSNELCNTAPYHHGRVSMNMVCADSEMRNGRGPCAGDTGGPLMIRSSKDSSRLVLAGIASWSTTCEDLTRPAVYTRVPRYEPWIRANTRDAMWCRN